MSDITFFDWVEQMASWGCPTFTLTAGVGGVELDLSAMEGGSGLVALRNDGDASALVGPYDGGGGVLGMEPGGGALIRLDVANGCKVKAWKGETVNIAYAVQVFESSME